MWYISPCNSNPNLAWVFFSHHSSRMPEAGTAMLISPRHETLFDIVLLPGLPPYNLVNDGVPV